VGISQHHPNFNPSNMSPRTDNEPKYPCLYLGCNRYLSSMRNFKRHERCFNPDSSTPTFWCTTVNCERSCHHQNAKPFYRKDQYDQHKKTCANSPSINRSSIKKHISASAGRHSSSVQIAFPSQRLGTAFNNQYLLVCPYIQPTLEVQLHSGAEQLWQTVDVLGHTIATGEQFTTELVTLDDLMPSNNGFSVTANYANYSLPATKNLQPEQLV
jgi:hypothetical protein